MLIRDYSDFVVETDFSSENARAASDIALYGLVGEIGSLVAVLKKKLLSRGRQDWNEPNVEIVEELGDCLWYLFAFAIADGIGTAFLRDDVRELQRELQAVDDRGDIIRSILETRTATFLDEAPRFLAAYDDGSATLDDYRRLAFNTSRTGDEQLVEVCVAVLQQLGAELFRRKLPPIEHQLNQKLVDRPTTPILGEIAWHLSALASLYQVELDHVATRNADKLRRRFVRSKPTPLPDRDAPETQRLPRKFTVVFAGVGPARSRMYMNGKRLGDDLTDNAYLEDGYRFHDVMHLAFAAKLGWSPVLRRLMGRKRRWDSRIDEIEDGARAAIVEEAVIKAIHSEGERKAQLRNAPANAGLFRNGADISFEFLKRIASLVSGLEVQDARYWEWESAIVEGFALFQKLRKNRRGTIDVDIEARTLTYSEDAYVDVIGGVAGTGTVFTSLDGANAQAIEGGSENPEKLCRRRSVAAVLGVTEDFLQDVVILGWRGDLVDVRLGGAAQDEAWRRGIMAFRVSVTPTQGGLIGNAIAISDLGEG